MSTLDELLKKRKEIDRQIREIRGLDVVYEDAKYFVERYAVKADDHCIAVKCVKDNGLVTWKTIVAEGDKAHAIGRFRKQIQDMQGLLKLLEGVER